MEPAPFVASLDVLFHEERELQWYPNPFVVQSHQPRGYQVAVLGVEGRLAGGSQCGARNDTGAPIRTQMILGVEEDGGENSGDAFGVCAVGFSGGAVVGIGVEAAGEKHAGEVADGGDDFGEVIAAFPEAVVGCLIAEDLEGSGVN